MDEAKIDRIEGHIRNKLQKELKTIAAGLGNCLDGDEMLFFSAKYANEPSEFVFSPGERMLLGEIANCIKLKGSNHFILKSTSKVKMDKKTTIKSAIGLVFNDYRQFNHKKIPIQPLPTADLIESCKKK